MATRRSPASRQGTVVVDVTTTDGLSERLGAQGVVLVDPSSGGPMGTNSIPTITQAAQTSYTLATNATITATTGTTPVTSIAKGNYVWNAVFTGTSVKLQSLGADGSTWFDVATLSASGIFAGEIRLGSNAQIRLYNPNGTSDTGVYSSLS